MYGYIMGGVLEQKNTWFGLGSNESKISVSYQWKYNTLTILLDDNKGISVPISLLRELEGMTQEEINQGSLSPDGITLCWEKVGVYIGVKDLMSRVGLDCSNLIS